MLTLMLLRHAKAIGHGQVEDFARTLTDRGWRDAFALGAHMAGLSVLPDLALVSSAARTRQTFERFAAGAAHRCTVRFEDNLYNATSGQWRDLLRIVDPHVKTLLFVGHNPGIMEAAILFARDGDGTDLLTLRNRFPPCALAVIAFDQAEDWLDARASGGRIDLLLMPEDVAVRD